MISAAHSKVFFNALMLYGMTAAKVLLPMIALPYLTRVLSKDCYGVVTYVKTLTLLAQALVDFGFQLSATRDIARASNDREAVNSIIGGVLLAKLLLSVVAVIAVGVGAFALPALHGYAAFTFLSLLPIVLSVFMFDDLFRGIQEMQVITSRFVVMRMIAVALTLLLVRGDGDLLLLPLLETAGSLAAVMFVWRSVKHRGFRPLITGFSSAVQRMRDAMNGFMSVAAASIMTLAASFLAGIWLPLSLVSEWGLCLQIVAAAQLFYGAVADSLFPHMAKTRDLRFAMRYVGGCFVFVLLGGAVLCLFATEILGLVGGAKYVVAAPALRALVPLMVSSFLTTTLSWPVLGMMGGEREVTAALVTFAALQVVALLLAGVFGHFTLVNLALIKDAVDALLCITVIVLLIRRVRR